MIIKGKHNKILNSMHKYSYYMDIKQAARCLKIMQRNLVIE